MCKFNMLNIQGSSPMGNKFFIDKEECGGKIGNSNNVWHNLTWQLKFVTALYNSLDSQVSHSQVSDNQNDISLRTYLLKRSEQWT